MTIFFVLEVVLPRITSLKFFEERKSEQFSIEIHIYGHCLLKLVHVRWLFQQGNVLGDFRYYICPWVTWHAYSLPCIKAILQRDLIVTGTTITFTTTINIYAFYHKWSWLLTRYSRFWHLPERATKKICLCDGPHFLVTNTWQLGLQVAKILL